MSEDKFCADCGRSLENGYAGREETVTRVVNRDKTFMSFIKSLFEAPKEMSYTEKVMVYRCHECNNNKFVAMVNSDPTLISRYYDIYGKSVEEVILNEKPKK